jgi:hypothetical protein
VSGCVLTLAAYIQAGIRTSAGTRTILTGVSVLFLHPSFRQMTGYFLKLSHDHNLPYPFSYLLTNHLTGQAV